MTATKVVVKFTVFLVAVLDVVAMGGFTARRVVISAIRASRGSSRVGDARAQEGKGTGKKTCLRGVLAVSGARWSRGIFRVRVVRGVCGFRGARGVRGRRCDQCGNVATQQYKHTPVVLCRSCWQLLKRIDLEMCTEFDTLNQTFNGKMVWP